MSADQFVQQFYTWYVPIANKISGEPSSNLVLTERAGELSPDLARGLREDAEASSRAVGEIVGIDFDPFLGAQDVCEAYHVGPGRREGAVYLVDVFGVCSGTTHSRPDVVAEVAEINGAWQFVNFRYPNEKTDLTRELRQAQQNRTNPHQ